jgi:glycosyltransferase involved in cell wall biosynthesis
MKVLLVAPAPPPAGGIQTVTENLMKFIQQSGNGTELVLYNTTHRLRPMTSQSIFVRLFTGIVNSLSTYFKVSQIIKHQQPDVMHLASSSSLALIKDVLLVSLANRLKIPTVMHWHFGRIPQLKQKKNWEWRLLVKVIRKSTMSIVIDQRSYDALKVTGFENVAYVPNPLAARVEQFAREFINHPVSRNQGRFIFVGHIIREKGVYEQVEACLQIPEIAELMMVGPGEELDKNELVKLASVRDDKEWLKLTGEVDIEQVIEQMKQSSVLLLPSYTEGFPMVILEAMAMGCVVVATNVGAIPEMLDVHSTTPCGVCISPQSASQLKDALIQLVSHPEELEAMRQRAMKRVLSTYTVEKVYAQYKSVWKKSLHRFGEGLN